MSAGIILAPIGAGMYPNCALPEVELPRRGLSVVCLSSAFQLRRFQMKLSTSHLLPPLSPCYEILSVDQWRTCLLNTEPWQGGGGCGVFKSTSSAGTLPPL